MNYHFLQKLIKNQRKDRPYCTCCRWIKEGETYLAADIQATPQGQPSLQAQTNNGPSIMIYDAV